MADTENQVQTEEEQDAESSKYWNEAVNARTGEDGEPSEPVEPVQEQASEVQEVDGEPEEPEAESEDTGEESEGTEEDDPWAQVPEDQRREFEEYKTKAEKYEHETRSNRGRLAALQRKYDELSRKLEEQSTQKSDDKPPVDSGDSIFDFPEWKQFEDDFGDVAKPQKAAMRRLYEVMHSRLQDTDKVSQELRASEDERKYQQEANKLENEWPNWSDFVEGNREEFDSFVEQNEVAKDLMAPNTATITNASKAKALLVLFNDHLTAKNGESTKPAEKAKPNSQPRELSPKRKRQLESAATIAPRSHPAPGRRSDDLPEPDDYETSFRYFENMAQR